MELEKSEYYPVLQAVISKLFSLENTIEKVKKNKSKVDEKTFNIIMRDFDAERETLRNVKRKLEQSIYNEAHWLKG